MASTAPGRSQVSMGRRASPSSPRRCFAAAGQNPMSGKGSARTGSESSVRASTADGESPPPGPDVLGQLRRVTRQPLDDSAVLGVLTTAEVDAPGTQCEPEHAQPGEARRDDP